MKRKFVRTIAMLAIGGLLAVGGSGMAAASVLDNGKGATSTQAAGARLLELRDELTKVAYAGDATAARSALERLDPELATAAAGEKYTIQAAEQEKAGVARQYTTEISRVLDDPSVVPVQLPPLPLPPIPDLPGPLKIVSDLLKAVLGAVSGIVAGLLGAVPVPPLPVPPLPVP